MLQPAIQPISKLDYERPLENVSVVIESTNPFAVKSSEEQLKSTATGNLHRIQLKSAGKEKQWLPLEIVMSTVDDNSNLKISWFTEDDSRMRAFPSRRFLLPWAKPLDASSIVPIDRAAMPELAGGDWERGKKLFMGDATNCYKCHKMNGEGAKIGPNLSNLVHRDYESVLRDIVEPSAAVNPDYLNYIVAMSDGKVNSGVIHSETPAAITLADGTGKLTEVLRSDIDEIKPSKLSVMPQDVVKQLSAEQIRDLMTFLLLERPSTETK